ncbi:MAG: hypothetical protein RR397_11390 [Odoribacter sp.]
MKNYKIGIWLLTLAFAAFGCSDEEAELIVPSLEVGEKEFSFDEVTTHTLAIEANGHWTAKAIKDSSEFIVSPTEGNGKGEVTITLNRSKAENISGYLKVTYMDGTDEGLEVARGVKLLASKLDMGVPLKSVTFNPMMEYTKLQVNIDGKWTATLSDTTWCAIDRREGEGQGCITLALKEGVKLKGKTAELIVVPAAFPRVKYIVKINVNQIYTHNECVVINKASVGKGIDVVILGDFFTVEDLKAGGIWEEACNIFMKFFFAMEPYKSHRDYFNVYAIAYPNDRDLWYEESVTEATETIETPFATYHPGGKNTLTGISATKPQKEAAYKYAYEHSPVAKEKGTLKNLIVGLAINTNWRRYGILAWANNVDKFETCGMVLTPIPMFGGEMTGMFGHEMLGHGFGDFSENYQGLSGEFEFTPAWPKEYFLNQQREGILLDTEFSSNPDEFINRAWAELYKMNYRNVYIAEGARRYEKGVWRSSYKNVMEGTGNVNDEQYYSPVQRELILRKIYKLAGFEAEYSLQTFLNYDVINEELDRRMIDRYAPKP